MNDTLHYISQDPVYRKYHHQDLTFGQLYVHQGNFILSLCRNEVVHGKGSLIGKRPATAGSGLPIGCPLSAF
jgi:1,4-alpha-glucan branching enzyme